MIVNMYDEFANLYDGLMSDFDYENWFNYLESIFYKYHKKPKRVLEMACGTGNLSHFFAEKGYKLTCFDLSEEMLSIAYKKLNRFKNVKLFRQNMIDFKFKDKFEAIVSICDSINYITDDNDLLGTFKNVYDHLEDGGIFTFDINSYYKLKNIIGNNTFIEDREDIFYTWENFYEEETNICNFYLSFFYSEDGENFRRFDEEHRERAYKIQEIVKLLNQVGFSRIDIYEAFTFDSPNDETERINFIALKE